MRYSRTKGTQEHWPRWVNDLPGINLFRHGADGPEFVRSINGQEIDLRPRRGFIDFASCPLQVWLGPGPAIVSRHPVRKVRAVNRNPPLNVEQIRAWAESHRRRKGFLPRSTSGPVAEAPGESWDSINRALRHGRRGLPGGSSLADILAEHPESTPRRGRRPPLKVDLILEWADDYRQTHGTLPTALIGTVRLNRNENWRKIDNALRLGLRGLPRLLKRRR